MARLADRWSLAFLAVTVAIAFAAWWFTGVLVKGAKPLEAMARIRTLILDKTGTLTDGRPRIVSIDSTGGMAGDEILRLAAAADQASKHPVAQAIVAAAKARGMTLPVPRNRLGRATTHLPQTVAVLENRGVGFSIVDRNHRHHDPPTGRLLFRIFGALGQSAPSATWPPVPRRFPFRWSRVPATTGNKARSTGCRRPTGGDPPRHRRKRPS